MFNAIDLSFTKGEILTKVMLGELYDFPKAILGIQYHNYPDGIISGTQFIQDDDEIFIDKGIVKYSNHFYRLENRFNLSEFIANLDETCKADIRYKIILVPKEIPIDQRNGQISKELIPCVHRQSDNVDGIPLLYFKLFKGNIKIPNFDANDEEGIKNYFCSASSFSVVHIPYSGQTGTTFHPFIFEKLKEMLIVKSEKSNLDYIVLNEIIKNNIIELEFIEILVKEEIGKEEWDELCNEESQVKREKLLSYFIEKLQCRATGSFNTEVRTSKDDNKYTSGGSRL